MFKVIDRKRNRFNSLWYDFGKYFLEITGVTAFLTVTQIM